MLAAVWIALVVVAALSWVLTRLKVLDRKRRPTWIEFAGFALVVFTLGLVANQLAVANRQLRESQHLTPATATLDFVDQMVDRCLAVYKDIEVPHIGGYLAVQPGEWIAFDDGPEGYESGVDRILRLKGDMIDHLREGDWPMVDSAYLELRSTMCNEYQPFMPEHALDPRTWGEVPPGA